MIITKQDLEKIASIINCDHPLQANGVAIDSRAVQPGNIFVAIPGSHVDGHDFIDRAKEKGAAAAIVERQVDTDLPIIIVDDSIKALQELAQYKRQTTTAKMIAVTGSVGKTTTKEMLFHALSPHGKTYRNIGNLNNHIGLPLSLLNAPDDAAYIILEMGMNHAGEIALLTDIMQPDIAIITKIGPVHIEFFSSVQDIAAAKAEIFLNTRGIAILNRDDQYYDYLYNITKKFPDIKKIVSVGRHYLSEFRLLSDNADTLQISTIEEQIVQYQSPVMYNHIVDNSLFALGVVDALNLDVQLSATNLQNFSLEQGRGNIHYKNDVTIIDDSYNASPPSIKAALQSLSTFQGRKIAILGDMLELGERSQALHEELAVELERYKIDLVFTVGEYMQYLFGVLDSAKKGQHFSDAYDAIELSKYVKKGDVILVKGSRSVKMEKVVQNLLLHV